MSCLYDLILYTQCLIVCLSQGALVANYPWDGTEDKAWVLYRWFLLDSYAKRVQLLLLFSYYIGLIYFLVVELELISVRTGCLGSLLLANLLALHVCFLLLLAYPVSEFSVSVSDTFQLNNFGTISAGEITLRALMTRLSDFWPNYTVDPTTICLWARSSLMELQMEHYGMHVSYRPLNLYLWVSLICYSHGCLRKSHSCILLQVSNIWWHARLELYSFWLLRTYTRD